MSRIVCVRLFVVAGMLATVLPASAAGFSDVPADHPYADAIAYAQAEGIVQGYSDGTFRPSQPITRAEFTQIIVDSTLPASRIAGCDTTALRLADVPSTAWFAPAVCAGQAAGYLRGYADGRFRPADTINFAESATLLARARLNLDSVPQTHLPWWKPAINALGAVGAVPATYTSPSQVLTRGEMAEMIFRLGMHREGSDAASASIAATSVRSVPASAVSAPVRAQGAYLPYEEGVLERGESVVLYFFAPWCPYCQTNHARLKAWRDDGVLPTVVYKVDYDTATDLKERFGVSVQDTFVRVGADGTAESRVSFPADFTLRSFLRVE